MKTKATAEKQGKTTKAQYASGKRVSSLVAYNKTHKRETNVHWRGGRYSKGASSGEYVWLNLPSGVVLEHKYVVEKTYGKLPQCAVIHHVDLDKTNNERGNLLVCTQAYHAFLHQRMARRYAEEHLKAV